MSVIIIPNIQSSVYFLESNTEGKEKPNSSDILKQFLEKWNTRLACTKGSGRWELSVSWLGLPWVSPMGKRDLVWEQSMFACTNEMPEVIFFSYWLIRLV